MSNILQELKKLSEHYIYVHSKFCSLGSDEWEFEFVIDYLPLADQQHKRRAPYFKTVSSFIHSGGPTYSGAWPTQEEALIQGIKYANEKLLTA